MWKKLPQLFRHSYKLFYHLHASYNKIVWGFLMWNVRFVSKMRFHLSHWKLEQYIPCGPYKIGAWFMKWYGLILVELGSLCMWYATNKGYMDIGCPRIYHSLYPYLFHSSTERTILVILYGSRCGIWVGGPYHKVSRSVAMYRSGFEPDIRSLFYPLSLNIPYPTQEHTHDLIWNDKQSYIAVV